LAKQVASLPVKKGIKFAKIIVGENKLREVIRKIVKEDFAGSYPEKKKKKFDNKRRKQSEVLGYKLTGVNDVKTEIDDATIKEGLRGIIGKVIKEGFGDKFGKMINSYDIKIVQNALAMAKQQADKDVKGKDRTPKLIAIKTINRMKEYRNKIKAPNLKKEFQKANDKLEKDYKTIKEHMAGGLTYKKGKTVTVTHKTSGKELVIIDNPKVKKEYEKIGYFAEGKITEAKESAIDVAKRVVQNKQHEKGLDLTTANFIMQVYKAYDKNPSLQRKLEKLPLKKMISIVYKLIK
jgi:hypothetical protein